VPAVLTGLEEHFTCTSKTRSWSLTLPSGLKPDLFILKQRGTCYQRAAGARACGVKLLKRDLQYSVRVYVASFKNQSLKHLKTLYKMRRFPLSLKKVFLIEIHPQRREKEVGSPAKKSTSATRGEEALAGS